MNIKNKIRYGVQISDNISENSNGYLECYNCPIGRTGEQTYLGQELSSDLDEDKEYIVKRYPRDVFDSKFMASLENKDIALYHPNEDITINNVDELSKGYMRDIRAGKDPKLIVSKEYLSKDGNNTLYADLVIKDKNLITMVKDGTMRELSIGYEADYIPMDEDTFMQIPTNANHIAVVPKGRAMTATIRDSKEIAEVKDIEPKEKELQEEFVGRFMENTEMSKEYPDEKQRMAIAISIYTRAYDENVLDTIVIKALDGDYEFHNMTADEALDIYINMKQ